MIFALCACALGAKSQVIAGLDEVALLGDWHAVEYGGVWSNIGYCWPLELRFRDEANSYIIAKRNGEVDPRNMEFNGYWIGGTATGRYTLHFICRREYGTSNTGLSMVNFVITNFNGEEMTIETYDGSGIATFTKSDSGISEVSADMPEATQTYTISGMGVKNPITHGIYIQGDGKKIVK